MSVVLRNLLLAKRDAYRGYKSRPDSLYARFKLNVLLPRVERALEKIDEDTYNICDDCGEEIPQARLDLVPAAVTCVGCQEAHDVRCAGRPS